MYGVEFVCKALEHSLCNIAHLLEEDCKILLLDCPVLGPWRLELHLFMNRWLLQNLLEQTGQNFFTFLSLLLRSWGPLTEERMIILFLANQLSHQKYPFFGWKCADLVRGYSVSLSLHQRWVCSKLECMCLVCSGENKGLMLRLCHKDFCHIYCGWWK